jgi:hypothetical protein
MRTTPRLAALGALAALTVSLTACSTPFPSAAAAPVAAAPGAAQPTTDSDGVTAVGLTADGVLVEFDTNDPAAARELGEVTGLEDDDRLVGIDYRVQDGKLYGVGDQGGVYTIDGTEATKVRQLTEDLDGDSFGVDFNPAANALRIVSDTGQNLRQPFANDDAPTAKDTALTNPAVPPATGTTPAKGVTAVGYTNNDTEQATATTLFDLDTELDRIAIQSPANAGTLAPAGNLPADVGLEAGLDVYSTLEDGRTVANDAYATVEVDGDRKLWAVDLLTGVATDKGQFALEVVDLAVKLEQ